MAVMGARGRKPLILKHLRYKLKECHRECHSAKFKRLFEKTSTKIVSLIVKKSLAFSVVCGIL
jgi:hypothetical protein